jgi:predicted membrane-bound mannosyltransferase
VLTAFGASVVTFMMLMYALERRHPAFILAFACGCALSSIYGFLAGTWPFGVVEIVWALVALNRYMTRARGPVGASRHAGDPR